MAVIDYAVLVWAVDVFVMLMNGDVWGGLRLDRESLKFGCLI